MLQEHSFFSKPLIYFGMTSEEGICGEEEWDDPEALFWEGGESPGNQKLQVGLILHWLDTSQENL